MLYKTENSHGGDIYEVPVRLDFSISVNPLGTPENVIKAIQEAAVYAADYPDPYCRKLIRGLSRKHNIPERYILCGNGAAELIYAFCDALKPGTALLCAPTFSEYAIALERNNCKISYFFLQEGREKDFLPGEKYLKLLSELKPDAAFLCNPNNPDGGLIPEGLLSEILDVCKEKEIKLFLDECFIELSDGSSISRLAQEYPCLFILNAFTKTYAMSGIRLGYCICSDGELLKRISRQLQPWNVSLPAQAAGVAALEDDIYVNKARELISAERKWLSDQLEQLGFYVCRSQANYILFYEEQNTCTAQVPLHEKLVRQGILIRNCDNFPGLGKGWYRAGIKQHDDNLELIETMKKIGLC